MANAPSDARPTPDYKTFASPVLHNTANFSRRLKAEHFVAVVEARYEGAA